MIRSLCLCLLAAAAGADDSFEKGLHWALEVGAHHGDGRASKVAIDRMVAKHGKASVRLSGDAGTKRWMMPVKLHTCKGGDRVLCTVAARSRNLRREAVQYRNANVVLIFFGTTNKRLGIVGSPVLPGDRDWVDLTVHAFAPAGSTSVKIGLISSMSGTVWFDDVRMKITHTEPRDRQARAAAFEALRIHLDRSYPHFGIEGRALDKLPIDADDEDFLGALKRMLLPLKDMHVFIETPRGRIYTPTPNPHRPNWNDAAIRAGLTETLLDTGGHLVGRIGDVGYARIATFMKPEGFDRIEKALSKLDNARALILDVRPNGGGDEKLAWRIAGRFTDQETAYGMIQVRDRTLTGHKGFGPLAQKKFKGKKKDGRKVIVLQGPYCASSTEWFLLMMRAAGKTTLGLPSRGGSGNPRPFRLFDDVTVYASSWRAVAPDGTPIEGNGVKPMVRFEANHRAGDPTLRKALALLR